MHDKTQNTQFVTTDSWKEWCTASYWSNEAPLASIRFQTGDVVFCKIDEVLRLFEQLRLTRRRIVLVTGEGDLPCDAFRQSFLPANVDHWFATNVTNPHPRVTALPLGLGSPKSSTTLKADEIAAARNAGRERDQWLYVNFRPNTNPGERLAPYEHFQKIFSCTDWGTFEPPSERGANGEFLGQLVRHRFVLCPPGNGVDTHRMWETLLAGAIPVVKRSQAMQPFSSLPILFVDDFQEVTKEFLEKATREIEIPKELPSVMKESFWEERIHQQQRLLVERPLMSWREWVAESAAYGASMICRRLREIYTN
ncbi:MAG: hypothetical protein ACOYOI_07715 [Chthoniobacterales bacterium]